MTAISVPDAAAMDTIELLGVLAAEVHLSGGPLGFRITMDSLNNSIRPFGIEFWVSTGS